MPNIFCEKNNLNRTVANFFCIHVAIHPLFNENNVFCRLNNNFWTLGVEKHFFLNFKPTDGVVLQSMTIQIVKIDFISTISHHSSSEWQLLNFQCQLILSLLFSKVFYNFPPSKHLKLKIQNFLMHHRVLLHFFKFLQ